MLRLVPRRLKRAPQKLDVERGSRSDTRACTASKVQAGNMFPAVVRCSPELCAELEGMLFRKILYLTFLSKCKYRGTFRIQHSVFLDL
eukprot:1145687-Pelagomonas_calceolata.AAC.7